MVAPSLLERLRTILRRDPSDADVALLISLMVRDPFILYSADRSRLRALAAGRGTSGRQLLIAQAAQELLTRSGTPAAGVRRPESGTMEKVVRSPGGAADDDPDASSSNER